MINASQESHSPDELDQQLSFFEAQLDQLDTQWQSQQLNTEQSEPMSQTSTDLDTLYGAPAR